MWCAACVCRVFAAVSALGSGDLGFDCVCIMVYAILVIAWVWWLFGCFQSGLVRMVAFSLVKAVTTVFGFGLWFVGCLLD